MNSTINLSPAMTSAERIVANDTLRREALMNLLGECEIAVHLLDGNTVYVNIHCAEQLYADGYSIKNGALFQNAK